MQAERPIIFSAPMVRAILAGSKSQTRRVVKFNDAGRVALGGKQWHIDDPYAVLACPYGQPGDRLWVKETWRPRGALGPWDMEIDYAADGATRTIRDGEFGDGDWTMPKAAERGNASPLFMPRWASRITLEVTGACAERLQAIRDDDALAEGMHIVRIGSGYRDRYSATPVAWADVIEQQARAHESPIDAYRDMWESINGPGSWHANPWVWAVEFRRIANG